MEVIFSIKIPTMRRKTLKIQLILFFSFILLISSVSSQAPITINIDDIADCNYRWFCSNWNSGECLENGVEKRSCTNAGDCPDDYNRPEEKRACNLGSPKQLFDIKLELEKYEFVPSGDLVAWIRFESFGAEPTTVNLTYSVYDIENNPFYIKHDSVVVETERFVVQRFSSLRLKPGRYSLVLQTVYGNNVEDAFRAEFKVRNDDSNILLGIIVLVLFLFLLSAYIRNKIRSKAKQVG